MPLWPEGAGIGGILTVVSASDWRVAHETDSSGQQKLELWESDSKRGG